MSRAVTSCNGKQIRTEEASQLSKAPQHRVQQQCDREQTSQQGRSCDARCSVRRGDCQFDGEDRERTVQTELPWCQGGEHEGRLTVTKRSSVADGVFAARITKRTGYPVRWCTRSVTWRLKERPTCRFKSVAGCVARRTMVIEL